MPEPRFASRVMDSFRTLQHCRAAMVRPFPFPNTHFISVTTLHALHTQLAFPFLFNNQAPTAMFASGSKIDAPPQPAASERCGQNRPRCCNNPRALEVGLAAFGFPPLSQAMIFNAHSTSVALKYTSTRGRQRSTTSDPVYGVLLGAKVACGACGAEYGPFNASRLARSNDLIYFALVSAMSGVMGDACAPTAANHRTIMTATPITARTTRSANCSCLGVRIRGCARCA